jgi:hypothetical protein
MAKNKTKKMWKISLFMNGYMRRRLTMERGRAERAYMKFLSLFLDCLVQLFKLISYNIFLEHQVCEDDYGVVK